MKKNILLSLTGLLALVQLNAGFVFTPEQVENAHKTAAPYEQWFESLFEEKQPVQVRESKPEDTQVIPTVNLQQEPVAQPVIKNEVEAGIQKNMSLPIRLPSLLNSAYADHWSGKNEENVGYGISPLVKFKAALVGMGILGACVICSQFDYKTISFLDTVIKENRNALLAAGALISSYIIYKTLPEKNFRED